MYYTNTGDQVTLDEIKTAVDAGTARIIVSYKPDGGLSECLCLDCKDFDTRGEEYRMLESAWTIRPTYQHALRVAWGGRY